MLKTLLSKALPKLIEIIFGYYQLSDGKTVVNSKAAGSAILGGTIMLCVVGMLYLDPAVLKANFPQFSDQTIQTALVAAGALIWQGIRYLVGKREEGAKNIATTQRVAAALESINQPKKK